jgi:hypothetical protein
MNNLNTYKIFETLNSRGYKSLTEDEFDKILKVNCKNWTKAKTSIYRGQRNLGDYVYMDPRGTHRNSIEDTNLHIELMSNLPSWKEYPKYSESIIGITKLKYAENYGSSIYEIIPFDNTNIGICPSQTIWESFGDENDDFSNHPGWGDYIYLVRDFLESLGIDAEYWKDYNNLTIEDHLKSIDIIPRGKNRDIDEFLNKIDKSKDITGVECYNFINNEIFNPIKRGFKYKKYEPGFEVDGDVQIWISGPVLLINKDLV